MLVRFELIKETEIWIFDMEGKAIKELKGSFKGPFFCSYMLHIYYFEMFESFAV